MITLVDIKKSINDVLKTAGYKIYDNEVKEGFKRPCFFVQLFPIGSNMLNKSTSENSLMVEVVYFSRNKTDLENVQMYDLLKNRFIPILSVKDRKLLVKNFGADTEDGVMSIKFDLNYFDSSGIKEELAEPATEIEINIKGGN